MGIITGIHYKFMIRPWIKYGRAPQYQPYINRRKLTAQERLFDTRAITRNTCVTELSEFIIPLVYLPLPSADNFSPLTAPVWSVVTVLEKKRVCYRIYFYFYDKENFIDLLHLFGMESQRLRIF